MMDMVEMNDFHMMDSKRNRESILNEVFEVMLEKRIVYKVPTEVKKQSIETLKVRKTTLEYLRQNGFKTVEDIIDKQLEIPSEYRGNIYAYLMFGIEG